MNLKTFASLMKGGKMPVLLRFKLMFSSFYRLSFFASMVDTVILERLARGPVTAESLLEDIGNDPSLRHAIESWLGLGVRLGMLKKAIRNTVCAVFWQRDWPALKRRDTRPRP